MLGAWFCFFGGFFMVFFTGCADGSALSSCAQKPARQGGQRGFPLGYASGPLTKAGWQDENAKTGSAPTRPEPHLKKRTQPETVPGGVTTRSARAPGEDLCHAQADGAKAQPPGVWEGASIRGGWAVTVSKGEKVADLRAVESGGHC